MMALGGEGRVETREKKGGGGRIEIEIEIEMAVMCVFMYVQDVWSGKRDRRLG